MIYKNIQLHNVGEAVEIPGRPGVLLQRIPENVRRHLRPATMQEYRKPTGVEIRFVSDWKPVKITLASYEGESKAYLFFGDFQAGEYVIGREPTEIEIPVPLFQSNPDFSIDKYTFHPDVRRILLRGAEVHFINIEGSGIRPPEIDEIPALKYLAYGTSITHGASATTPALAYVKQTAWRLGADVFNYGASGTAFCEKELADYFAMEKDWDFATICVSVNMFNQGVTIEEFRVKAQYMIWNIAGQNPGKPVICISMFPFFMDINDKLRWPERFPVCSKEEYRNILKAIVEESRLDNLHFIDGRDLLKEYSLLSHDVLHPGDYGMIQISENLAAFIKPLLK